MRLWAVGDSGDAGSDDERVAAFIERRGAFDRLLYLGDVYENGTADEFRQHYHPALGRFKSITSPTPGNHEWPNVATGYDPYWGDLAPRTNGGHYYSFDTEGWHVVSLNSEEDTGPGSPQVAWLRSDLARHPGTCTVAFFHRPRYSAQPGRGDDPSVEPLWQELAGRAVIVLNGHDHNYQRFRRNRGLVQFTVGTGGRERYDVDEDDPDLVRATDEHFGALRLRLAEGRASFEFLTLAGSRFDSGRLSCAGHAADDPPGVVTLRPEHRYAGPVESFGGRSVRARRPPRLTLLRRTSRGCSVWRGSSFARASCRTRRAVVAEGVKRWSYRLPATRTLPRGDYRLVARVTGRTGTGRDAVRFSVR